MNKDLKKQYEKALKWCEKARDILKVKRKWKIDHKERGYTQLDHHITWVKDGLKELEKKKSKEYESLVKEFIQQAEAGRVAKETENKELAKMLTSNLAMLHLKIEVALGKRPPEAVSVGKENLKKMQLEHYEKALKEAEQVQSALSKLSIDGHDFLGSVPLLIGTAKEHMKSGAGVAFALLSLGKVEAERPIQIKQQELYLKFKSKLAEATSLKTEVSDFLSMNANLKQPESNKNLTEHIDSLEEIINEANKLVSQRKYGEAIEKLAEAKSHHKDVIGKLSGSDKKRFESYSKAKSSFMDSYEAELDRIHKAQALRGADEGETKKFLDDALNVLNEAKSAADKAAKPEDFEVAQKSLDKVEPLVEKAIEASKISKQEAERNLEKMSHWLLLLPAAERELQFMRTLAGTEAQQVKLEKLLLESKALVVRDPKTQMTTGYEEAWKKLQNYFEIVLEARRNFQELSKASLPESITKLFDQIELAIDASKQVAPAFWVEMTAQDLQESMDGIRKSIASKQPNAVEEGLKTLTEFASNLSTTVGEQMDLKTEVYKLLESFTTHRQSLIDAKVPLLMLGPVDRLIKVAETSLLTAHEWAQASAKITVAFNLMKEVEQYHATKSKQWFECYELLVSYRTVAREFVMWPPTASKARMVIDDCNGLEQQFNTTLDYEACANAFTLLQLKESYEALVKLKEGAPPVETLVQIHKQLPGYTKKIKDTAFSIFSGELFQLESKLEGVAKPFRNSIHLDVEKLVEEWSEYCNKPDKDLPTIKSKFEDVILKLEKLRTEAKNLLGNESELSKFRENLKGEELKAYQGDLPNLVASLIDQLEDPKAAELARRQLDKLKTNPATIPKLYENFRDDLFRQLEEQRRKVQIKFEGASQLATEIDNKLKTLKLRHKNFQPYQQELENRMLDIKSMIASNDPDLLELAKRSLNEVAIRVAEVDPEQRDEGDVRYHQVEAQWKKLYGMIGLTGTIGGAILVENRLPDTYARLIAEINKAVTFAMKSSPKEGLAALMRLENPVRAAVQAAMELNDEHERYKERKRAFEATWKELKKKTKSLVTEKNSSLEDYIQSRLNEAEGVRHTETGLPEAYKILEELEGKVLDLRNADSPERSREKMRAWETELAENFRAIRDLAREFNVELDDFKDRFIPSVKLAITKMEESGEMRTADAKDALKNLDSLAKQRDSAANVVKPYLAAVATLPHQKIGSDKAPDFDKAVAAFQQARSILENARRYGSNLASSTTTTNVNLAEDFGKVEKHWIEQVRNFASTIDETIKVVKGQIDEWIEDDDKVVEEQSKTATQLLTELRSLFSPTAFQKAFETLKANAKGSEEKAKLAKEKLAAREQALRTMRNYREELLHNPVIKKLVDTSNPFNQAKLLIAVADLRVSLKRIEVESLIGV